MTVIRPMTASDREPLRKILEGTGVFAHDEVVVAMELIDTVLEHPAQTDYVIRTSVDSGGRVTGYYCVGPTPMTEATYDLYWIAVSRTLHDKGIGGVLLAHAEDLVVERGGKLLVAETSSKPLYDHTRRFYLSHGYGELARIRDYYRPGDDLVIYGKYVSH